MMLLYEIAIIEAIMRSCWRDMQIVDLVNPGEDKSPLPPFTKGSVNFR
jgi:hypothetical protein